jgi:chromosome segregation ATPase
MEKRSDWSLFNAPVMEWWTALWTDIWQVPPQVEEITRWMTHDLTLLGESAVKDCFQLMGLVPQQDYAQLSSRNEALSASLAAKTDELTVQERRIADLLAAAETLKHELAEQKKQTSVQTRSIGTQKKQATKLKADLAGLKARVSEQKKEIDALKKEVATKDKALLQMERRTDQQKKSPAKQDRPLAGQAKQEGTA